MTGKLYDIIFIYQKAIAPETMRQIAREIIELRLWDMLQINDISILVLLAEHDNKINYRVVNDLVRVIPSVQARIAPNV